MLFLSDILNNGNMKKVVIFGGGGFVGTHLVRELQKDYKVVIVSRNPEKLRRIYTDIIVERLRSRNISKLVGHFEGAAAIVNLAGESVAGRWTDEKMSAIKKSRLDTDSIIVRAFLATKKHPEAVIQGSAIGIYGYTRMDKDIDESSQIGKHGFLPRVSAAHEEVFHQFKKLTRVVYIRTGMVLAKDGGSLPAMSMPVRMFLGGSMGSGKQWVSWIHINDVVRAIHFLIDNKQCNGPYNLTAPNPVSNKEFVKTLSKELKRPCFMRTPGFFVKLFLGKMADELVLKGVKVLPAKLEKDGFAFLFSELKDAFADIYK